MAYRRLLQTINARYVLTSYSTDGTIPLDELLRSNVERGRVALEMQGYKRYRVSSQRFSRKPMNVEFVVIVDTHRRGGTSADQLEKSIREHKSGVLRAHAALT